MIFARAYFYVIFMEIIEIKIVSFIQSQVLLSLIVIRLCGRAELVADDAV